MEHKGLFYLYNLQNNIYNHNKKKSDNYPTFNIFNQTNNITNNITYITKRDNSNKDRPIILFPKSFNNSLNKKNKYNTLNNKKTKSNFNDIFINTTNKIKGEENIFHNKMKLRKQNYKKKYLNILTQNDSDSSRKKNKNINNNFLTMKNFENAEKKLKLKLIKFMNNNKDEASLKNNKNKKNNLLDIKNISKNNNNSSLNNISEISKVSTVMRDSKYYMNKSSELIKYIQTFYSKNKSYPETKINFYLYGRRIGQGAFGKVNLGLNVLTGRVVAIKSFKTTPIEKFQHKMKKIQYETELMKRFNHKNITKILEVFNDEEYMLIIMEYINGGNLFSFVKKRRKLSEKMAKFLFRQIILGIQHIHSKNVVHRDIKLENILIDFDNNVKICDFGIGKVLENEDELLYDKCGTPMYMAPEIILANDDNGYKGFPVDIWSSGITLYIMLSGSLPFNIKNKNNNKEDMALNSIKDKNNIFLQNQIVNVKPKEIENISIEAKNLLKGLLNKNPSKRLTCSQILNHPWLKHSNNNMDSLNLFTKAELTMMSKTYIDYRKGELEDLKENFTLSNLRNDEIKLEEKNITTKSTILDPFNSCINNDNNSSNNDLVIMEDSFDDFKNENIKLENDIMIFNNKVKEFNLNFEVNNNQEVDNGMIIKTQSDNVSSSSSMNNSLSLNDISKDFIEEKNNNKKNELNVDKNILNEIEQYGYDKKYVLNCIENNKLCHASTVFYLLKNYKDIE
jgi:serine/threonine protein kinase